MALNRGLLYTPRITFTKPGVFIIVAQYCYTMGRKTSSSVSLEAEQWAWLEEQPEDDISKTLRRVIDEQRGEV